MPRTTSKKAFAHKGARNTTAAHARKKSPARKKPGATKKRVKRTLSPRGRKKTKEAGASKAATKKSGVKKTGAKGTGVRTRRRVKRPQESIALKRVLESAPNCTR